MCPPGIRLSNIGKIIEEQLYDLNRQFKNIRLDSYVIMPNHLHVIIEILKRADTRPAPTISEIICSFKSRTTNLIIKEIKNEKIQQFDSKIWQRNYYEHVIRNEKEYYKIIEYIQENPIKWEEDKYYIKESLDD